MRARAFMIEQNKFILTALFDPKNVWRRLCNCGVISFYNHLRQLYSDMLFELMSSI